ncbi:uncharacterized protein LOC108739761 [Agrilus planipennis]|uniref:Uncharacterized protein LOC108739761 n=1 Tax=Agrilus planipennis TaxID=224129 RepID=A0A1W4WZK5_AGRPL|nr:uncharacterized protein LOC108739761 [Agrilus planipennis]
MKSFILISLICFLAISSAEYELDIDFPDEFTFDEFAKNDIFSPEVLRELNEELEKTYASNDMERSSGPIVAVINDYVDKLVANLNNFTSTRGLNELELPGISEQFSYKPVLITYTGVLNLTDGILSGISTIVRKGDVKITYDDKQLSILAPVGIRSLSIKYNYVAKLMNIGPKGGITGDVAETTFTFGLGYNLTGHRASLDTFKINKIGSIKLRFSGNILTDWLASLISNITLPFFKGIIRRLLEKNVYGVLEDVVEIINSALEKLFQKSIYCDCYFRLYRTHIFSIMYKYGVLLGLLAACYSLPENKIVKANFQIDLENKFDDEINQKIAYRRGIQGIENVGYFNEFADKLLKKLKEYMNENSMDPFQLPEVMEKFESPISVIPIGGKFMLTNGWMQGLTTIYRSGDITIILKDKSVTISVPVALEYVVINYKYGIKLMNQGPEGSVSGRINKLEFAVNMGYNLTTEKFCLTKFNVRDAGRISVSFDGNKLTDWVLNTVSVITTKVFKRTILDILEGRLGILFETAVDALNENNINITLPISATNASGEYIRYIDTNALK